MVDHNFFTNTGPYTIKDLAEAGGAEVHDPKTADIQIDDVAPLDKAVQGSLTFLDNVKYKDQLQTTKATVCVIAPELVDKAPEGLALIISKSVYKSYALIAQKFYPAPVSNGEISSDAFISKKAVLADNLSVGAGAVIQDGARVGQGAIIEAGAVIGENVQIGEYTRIGANASVSHSIIGNHVNIYPGARIGQDGFGFAIDPAGFVKVPQLGRVIIGDGVEIGANTTIDRGSAQDTVIGQGSWIDNLVQIGHNVEIGMCCVIVSQVGISGSSKLEDFVVLAGQVGVAGHITIGQGTRIGAQSGVIRSVPAGSEFLGSPAVPIRQFMRQIATLNRLVKKAK